MQYNEKIADTQRYLQQQEREIGFEPEEDMVDFVSRSVGTLAVRYFEPAVHELGALVPRPNRWQLHMNLIDSSDSAILLSEDRLPIGFSMSDRANRTDSLLLPIDNGLVKILTRRWMDGSNDDRCAMRITRYNQTTEDELAEISEAYHIDPYEKILLPRAVSYCGPPEQREDDTYGWLDPEVVSVPPDQAQIYAVSPDLRQAQTWSQIHTEFIAQTRVALAGLQALIR